MVNLVWSRRRHRPRPLRVARACAEAIATCLRNRRGERELARMSDYELHDLAITRGDIHKVAWQRAFLHQIFGLAA
jgi:uncharacterized protein YjiS (DUF1127 family)